MKWVVLPAGLMLLSVTTAAAQSLAAIAQKEAERRKASAPATRVYTDADLRAEPPPAAPASKAAATAPEAQAAEPAAEKDAAADDKIKPEDLVSRERRDEQYWRERAAQIRTRLDKLRADTGAIRARAEALRNGSGGGDPGQQAAELQHVSGDLRRFEAELRDIEAEWSRLEEHARLSNVPAAWLR